MSNCLNPNDLPRRGSALLITLSLLTLAIIMALAFAGLMRIELMSSRAYSDGLRSEELAQGAALWVIDDLMREISSDASSTILEPPASASGDNLFRLYRPKTTRDMVPQPWALDGTGRRTQPAPVVRASRIGALPDSGSTARYNASGGEDPALLPRPRTVPSAPNPRATAASGRYSRSWWNRPRLIDSAQLNNFQAPDWVLVTRRGPQEISAWEPDLANPESDKFVSGRFAYVIYDVGGLLDANHAGHAFNSNRPADLDIARKGSLHFADLREVGLTETQATRLAEWRNRDLMAAQPAARALTDWIFGDGAQQGYLQPPPGGQFFLSRQDLLRFAQKESWAGGAERFFTVHSLDRNAPSWFPPYNAPEGYVLSRDFQYRQRALNYRPASATVNDDLIVNHHLGGVRYLNPARAGELVVGSRFALDDMGLLTRSATASAGSEIHRKFGLLRSNSNQPWVYTSPDGSTIANRVKTLNEVARLGREPDFFELIQAAVLQGSAHHMQTSDRYKLIDRNGYANALAGNKNAQWNLGVRALNIGLSMIDQSDGDSYPTTVEFRMQTTEGSNPSFRDMTLSGVESVPYLSEFLIKFARMPSNVWHYGSWLAFELWNPHQNAAASLPDRPTQFRIAATNGAFRWVFGPGPEQAYNFLSGDHFVRFNLQNVSSAFQNPRVLRKSESSSSTPPTLEIPGEAQGFFVGGSIETMDPAFEVKDRRLPGGVPADPQVNSVTLRGGGLELELQYLDNGNWVTYQQFYGAGVATANDSDNTMGQAMETQNKLALNGARINAGTSFTNTDHWVAGRGRLDPRGIGMGFMASGSQEQPIASGTTILISAPNPDGSVRPGTGTTGIGLINRGRGSELTHKEVQYNAMPTQIQPGTGLGTGYFFSKFMTPAISQPQTQFPSGELADNIRRATPRARYAYQVDATTGEADVRFLTTGSFDAASSSDALAFDADGIPRRGDGNRFQNVRPDASTAPWNPSAAPDVPAKPVMLNRQLRSVGELGYVHRGQPWKTVNFFTGDSADAGLLDVFSVAAGEVVAGRINLNSAPREVLAAVLRGAGRSGMDLQSARPLSMVGDVQARAVAQDIENIIRSSGLTPAEQELLPEQGPFWSRADLVTRLEAMRQDTYNTNYSAIKTEREATVRALAEVSQTRTWNLLIDVVAESGRFAPGATSLDQFQSSGVRRYWVHVAIDRFTGEIVSRSMEQVNE